jgi:cation diffusion facilitator CzcD-associated flavoprotein CzcO
VTVVRPRVAVVGAGVSGIGMAIALQEAGYPFTLFEKAEAVGGTWRDNRYPGLTCDVPAFVYTFAASRKASWERLLAPGEEIRADVERVAGEYHLDRSTRFGTPITEATWRDDQWHLRSPHGDEGAFDVLVQATGFLHHPRLPDLEGLDDFAGPAFHSARWDHSVDLTGRRVGIIGTGSTGVQLTAALAGVAEQVTVFQRTPQWVFPFPNLRIPRRLASRFERSPRIHDAAVEAIERAGDWFLGGAARGRRLPRALFEAGCRRNLKAVRDPDLRRRLQPQDAPFCKRPVMSTSYYAAMDRADVELVDAPIERVTADSVVTRGGTRHEVDVLVFATGFESHAYMRPMAVTGPHGRTLDEAWAGGPLAYRTISITGFPNMFLLLGPHAPLLSIAIHRSVDLQARYVLQLLRTIERPDVAGVEPTAAATSEWLADVTRGLASTVWAHDCRSWYLDESGNPIMWPFDRRRWFELLAEPDLGDYALLHRSASAATA